MSSSLETFDHLKIPLDDILEATNHFSNENFIRQGGFGKIYKGKLKRSGESIDIVARRLDTRYGQGSKQFWTEVSMLSKLKHKNLVYLVGFCDEKNEKIVINKYEAKGSLDNYLSDPTIGWSKRLRICVGIARALSYIHYDVGRDYSVIHRNIKSSKVLLDYNYEPKLAGFGLSMTNISSRRNRLCVEDPCGSVGYFDPTYAKTGTVTYKSDIYSFGVVLFEVLFGMKAITDNRDIKLAKEAKSRYENEQLRKWIRPNLQKEMYGESLKLFSETAYDCLKDDREGRPSIHQVVMKLEEALDTQLLEAKKVSKLEYERASLRNEKTSPNPKWERMNRRNRNQERRRLTLEIKARLSGWKGRQKFGHYGHPSKREESHEEKNIQISLADIKLATQDFSRDNLIGEGGFGKVYRGNLLCGHGLKSIAAKRLGRTSDQGETELMTELAILSEYKHNNVIDLVSFCNENGEKVIVYDYASRGSLDKKLKSTELTWRKRLEICIDIARGLNFLHGTSDVKQDVVIHRDIKSANILLHDDWKACIADFGLSLISPVYQDINYVIDNVKGTRGYCDPLYMTTGFLTKESDIYSFGVVLFEMLCGRFVIEGKNSITENLVDLVRHHYKEGSLYEMVFEATKKQMATKSLTKFQNIAYQCIHEEKSKRPTACDVLIQLEKALEFQHLNISLDEIMLATQDFSHDNLIGKGDFWSVYKGQLTCADRCEIIAAKRLDRRSDQRATEHMSEIDILLEYRHENIISLVRYCDEKGENIMVYDYASISKGSLDRWLKYDGLTWCKRLEICIDIATGLTFLHGTNGAKQEVVIHGDIKSTHVLLNDDWKAKIADFGCSSISRIDLERNYVVNNAKDTPGYCDPLYATSRVLTKESDIYSFGVLLFEMLCGRFVMEHNSSKGQNLVHLVRHHFEEGTLYDIVFEATKNQLAPKSLTTFLNIAYQCLHEERSKRPTANDVLIQLKKSFELQGKIEELNISLENIMLATQDFSLDNLIGKGVSGPLYKGQVTRALGYEIIAAKRLDRMSDQRETERITELEVLLEYKHANIIALLGHCNEKRENIMVYEYASKGSLDRWVKYDGLTWRKRLEICVDIARGLTFLHGTSGAKQEVVIHRDIKSKNVLLNGDWKAKIANFGCSLIIPVSQEMKYVVNNAKGTPGYCDPLYKTTGVLTKESDIYSFGVLLFEMLCGRFVMEHNNSKTQNLVHMVRRHYEEGKLSEMVFEAAKKQIVPESLTTFQNIAYKCVHEERAKRPTANDVLIQLNKALEFQVEVEIWEPKLPRDFGKIIQMTYSPKSYYAMSNKDICTSLHKGFLLRENRVWFSIGTDGRRVEVISATEFHFKSYFGPDKWIPTRESRFGQVAWIADSSMMYMQFKIKALLLTPGINYRVNLLFKFCAPRENSDTSIPLEYHIGNKFLRSHCTTERDGGWLMKELFQFSSLAEEADIDVFLLGFSESHYVNQAVYIDGIEFQAINNMTHEEMEELKRVSTANVQQSPTDEGHWKVNAAEVQELPANEAGHVFAIVPWLLEKCCGN